MENLFAMSGNESTNSKYEFKLSKYEFKLSKYEFKLSKYEMNGLELSSHLKLVYFRLHIPTLFGIIYCVVCLGVDIFHL